MADGSDKTSKGIQKRLKREAHPQPLLWEGRGGCLKWGGHTDKRVNHKIGF